MIAFSHVFSKKNGQSTLEDAHFTIEPGECICVSGASGSGKEVLRLLAVLEKALKGKVTVDGVDLATLPPPVLQIYRRNIGFLGQEENLLATLSIAANIAMPLRMQKWKTEEMEQRVAQLLQASDLLSKAAQFPDALSRNERRCVSFLRAIAASPKILLLEEPPENMLSLLKTVHDEGATVILTTENPRLQAELHVRTIHLSPLTLSSQE